MVTAPGTVGADHHSGSRAAPGTLKSRPPVQSRRKGSPHRRPRCPSLIGIADRKHSDVTGFNRHRGIADLMRYTIVNQGLDMRATYGDDYPGGAHREATRDTATSNLDPKHWRWTRIR